jgi:hypothetical protein
LPLIKIGTPLAPEHAAVLDSRLTEALGSDTPEPDAGQLWRLRWGDTTALAVLIKVGADDFTVAPASLDEWMADDYTVVVAPSWSPIGTGIAVWVGLESIVPPYVLDVCLGEVDVLDQIAAVRQAYRKGISVEEVIVVGPPIIEVVDERREYRDGLALEFASLSEAEWLDLPASPAQETLAAESLVNLLRPVDPRGLAEALGLDAPSTFALLGGERLLAPEEASIIGRMVGIDPAVVLAATPPVPPGLLRELNHPDHRRAIEARAAQTGHTDSEERRLALRELLPVAARRAGDEAAPLDWRRLVRDRFGR